MLKAVSMTGMNCPAILSRIDDYIKKYRENPYDSFDDYRIIDTKK